MTSDRLRQDRFPPRRGDLVLQERADRPRTQGFFPEDRQAKFSGEFCLTRQPGRVASASGRGAARPRHGST